MKQIAFFIMLVSYATVVSSSPDITFHGNLIAPPTCIVSENKTIEIAFNEVIISDISGDNYKREVPWCSVKGHLKPMPHYRWITNDKKPNLLHQIYSGEFTGASVVSSRNSDEREKQPSFHRKFD